MKDGKRILLIVEDDQALNQQYQLFCQLAYAALPKTGATTTYQVETAFSFSEAVSRLSGGEVDLVSIDLALQSKEIGLKDKDRQAGNEPGGMRLLKSIQGLQKRPLVVVVSGETLLSYARDALQKYGVLAYFQKGQPGFEDDFLHTVQAGLAFLEAQGLLAQLEAYQARPEAIEQAGRLWEMARKLTSLAGLGDWNFPDNLETRLNGVKSRLFPGGNIPGEEWTKEYLRRRILRSDQWVLVQAYIQNYEAFAAAQASQVNPLLCFVSDLIEQTGEKAGCPEVFTGAWGHENLVGPCILALFPLDCAAEIGKIQQAVLAEFRAQAGKFVHGWQISPDHGPLPELALRSWRGVEQPFNDWPEFVDQVSRPGK